MLQIIPGIQISAPRDSVRLEELLGEAVSVDDALTVVRFPKGSVSTPITQLSRTSDGVDILAQNPSKDVLIVAVGVMADAALRVADLLAAQGIGATVIDPRWVVPVKHSILEMAAEHRLVVTIEDGIKVGGIGTRIRQDMRAAGVDTALNEVGLPDEFLEHASRDQILERTGLTAKSIAHDIVAQVLGAKVPHARAIDEPRLHSDLGLQKPQTN
jgi:1-deoxy-D-xylulose-5-phosphate synthase